MGSSIASVNILDFAMTPFIHLQCRTPSHFLVVFLVFMFAQRYPRIRPCIEYTVITILYLLLCKKIHWNEGSTSEVTGMEEILLCVFRCDDIENFPHVIKD